MELKKASEQINVFPIVRNAALHFLDTGKLPVKNWPLPKLQLEKQEKYSNSFPVLPTLIEIAIHEQRYDDTLNLYEKMMTKNSYYIYHLREVTEKLADAIAGTYPDKSVQIWRKKVENNINLVNKKGYQQASPYLRKIRDTLKKHNRESEWKEYQQDLKKLNAKRPRCLEILNSL